MRFVMAALVALCAGCTAAESLAVRPFQQTGIVEGFYGPPWSHQDRLDVLRFMGRMGLTHYYYAPKDDPYHRHRWREQYPEEDLARLRELAAVARESDVAFVYAISPGETMVYADSNEYATLRRKLDEIAALGVTAFALFLDDVPPTLEHEADRRAFSTVAQAHAAVINRLHRDLAATGGTLAVTPTTYTDAWGDRAYLRELGELVVPEVPFFWTGIDVQPPEITAGQARTWGELMAREPLVWDNYPVNDYARWRPFLGPLRRRAPDLANTTLGILSNPMNEAHASMIPLATLAEYVRDPQAYDPDAAQARTLVALYGEEAAAALGPFVEIYAEDGWHPNLFQPLFMPGEAIDVEAVRAGLVRLDASLEELDALAVDRPEIRVLADELRPFVAQTWFRLATLEGDPQYAIGDGRLAFRSELDRTVVPGGDAPTIDGDLREWSGDPWTDLHGDGPERPRVAFRHDAEFLYAAVRVPFTPRALRRGDQIGEGDHVAVVVQHDNDASRAFLSPEDLVALVAAPARGAESETLVRSIDMGPFTSTWQADNLGMALSEFHVSTFGTEPEFPLAVRSAGRRAEAGYSVELAVPRAGRDTVRVGLTVFATVGGGRQAFSLARRNYTVNPSTYAELVMGGGR